MKNGVDDGRRQLLRGSAALTGMLVAHSAIGLLAPSLAWALEVKTLDQHQADTILALAKTLYPHKDLPEAVYALVVKEIDAFAADGGQSTVAEGVRRLDRKAGRGTFVKAEPALQHRIVAALIADPLVDKVRRTSTTTLYDNDMAFAHFGYQGEAFSKGGYLRRGFNDLTWLPDPPADASPAAHV